MKVDISEVESLRKVLVSFTFSLWVDVARGSDYVEHLDNYGILAVTSLYRLLPLADKWWDSIVTGTGLGAIPECIFGLIASEPGTSRTCQLNPITP